MEVRGAHRSERDEVLDLLAQWYNDREFFARYNLNDSTFRDALCIVARDGGRLVSTVQIFARAINLAGQSVPMGGIGSVFTLEEYRHKGVASALMRLAVETMTREGFEVSLLFAERLTFYNQFGWREIERELDSDAWASNLKFAGNQPLHPGEGSEEYFIVTRDGERIAAYARITRFHGVTMVMEFGYMPESADAMLATFKYLAAEASGVATSFRREGDHRRAKLLRAKSDESASPILVTHTAHDPELETRLGAAGCPVAHHIDNNYMWRVLAPEKLARRFATTPEAASARAFELFADSRSLFWTADRF
jgi:predicted N-acetyltransferase YhbS